MDRLYKDFLHLTEAEIQWAIGSKAPFKNANFQNPVATSALRNNLEFQRSQEFREIVTAAQDPDRVVETARTIAGLFWNAFDTKLAQHLEYPAIRRVVRAVLQEPDKNLGSVRRELEQMNNFGPYFDNVASDLDNFVNQPGYSPTYGATYLLARGATTATIRKMFNCEGVAKAWFKILNQKLFKKSKN